MSRSMPQFQYVLQFFFFSAFLFSFYSSLYFVRHFSAKKVMLKSHDLSQPKKLSMGLEQPTLYFYIYSFCFFVHQIFILANDKKWFVVKYLKTICEKSNVKSTIFLCRIPIVKFL